MGQTVLDELIGISQKELELLRTVNGFGAASADELAVESTFWLAVVTGATFPTILLTRFTFYGPHRTGSARRFELESQGSR